MWYRRATSLAFGRPTAKPRHLGVRSGLIDKDQPFWVEIELTVEPILAATEENLDVVDAAPTPDDPAECVADKGYHSRAVLRDLDAGPWKTRISAPKQKGFSRWHGDDAARRAVTNNHARLLSGVAKQAFKLRAEIVERSFAHILDRGGMRRVSLRGRENVNNKYLLHVGGRNLSLLMRKIIGAGTPKEAVTAGYGAILVFLTLQGALLLTILAPKNALGGSLDISAEFPDWKEASEKTDFVNGLLEEQQ